MSAGSSDPKKLSFYLWGYLKLLVYAENIPYEDTCMHVLWKPNSSIPSESIEPKSASMCICKLRIFRTFSRLPEYMTFGYLLKLATSNRYDIRHFRKE